MTNATAYDAHYFATGCGRPYQRDAEWLAFFDGIAERVARDIGPASVLDAGCAFGFLVEALRRRGIDAFGVDVSEYAIGQVEEAVAPYCRVGSVTDPQGRRYDLVLCIEVLEHLSPTDAEHALDALCDCADDVLFSSTPNDFDEPTHVNVRPPAYWAEAFARRGFVRDIDFDASFITAWAARFRRGDWPLPRVVAAYEGRLWELSTEVEARRRLDLENRDALRRLTNDDAAGAATRRIVELEALLDAESRRWEQLVASPGGRVLAALQHIRAAAAPTGSQRERVLDRVLGVGRHQAGS